MHGLITQQAHQAKTVEQSGSGGEAFFVFIGDGAVDIGQPEQQPIEGKQRNAKAELRELDAVGPHCFNDRRDPQEVIEVGGDNAEDFEPEPFHPQGQDNDGHSEDDAGYEAVERRVMDSYGQVGQDKRQSGRGLRFVAQAVCHDGGRNGEHQEEIKFAGIDDVRGGHVINGKTDEIE